MDADYQKSKLKWKMCPVVLKRGRDAGIPRWSNNKQNVGQTVWLECPDYGPDPSEAKAKSKPVEQMPDKKPDAAQGRNAGTSKQNLVEMAESSHRPRVPGVKKTVDPIKMTPTASPAKGNKKHVPKLVPERKTTVWKDAGDTSDEHSALSSGEELELEFLEDVRDELKNGRHKGFKTKHAVYLEKQSRPVASNVNLRPCPDYLSSPVWRDTGDGRKEAEVTPDEGIYSKSPRESKSGEGQEKSGRQSAPNSSYLNSYPEEEPALSSSGSMSPSDEEIELTSE